MNEDNTDLADDAKVAFFNYALNTLSSRVDVTCNGTIVSTPSDTYPYKAFLEKELTFSKSAKKTQFQRELYASDIAGRLDKIDIAGPHVNTGFNSRRKACVKSNLLTLRGSLHLNILMPERLLLNRVGLRIKLSRSKLTFCLHGDANYKVKITKATFHISQVDIAPGI